MSISKHRCSDHYELKTYAKLFTCEGCKTEGYGQRYRCEPCGGELHKECRFPATTAVSHEFLPGSSFKFRREPLTRLDRNGRREFSKCCSACRRDICGSSYRCDATDEDLHPCCRKLDNKVVVDGTTFELRAGTYSKCSWCEKTKVTGSERDVLGWTYVSSCRKFNFHVSCMVEVMQEASTKSSGGGVGLERGELKQLARNGGSGGINVFEMIQMVLKIISAAFFGDPRVLLTDVIVELLARGLEGCARYCLNMRKRLN